MEIVFGISTILLLIAIFILVYVLKNKNIGDPVSRLTLYVSVIGIIISTSFSIYSALSIFETNENIIPNNEISKIDENTSEESKDKNEPNNSVADEIDVTSTIPSKDDETQTEASKTTENNDETYDDSKDMSLDFENDVMSKAESESYEIPLYETKTYSQNGTIIREKITYDPRGNTYNNAYVFLAEYTTLNTGGGYYDTPYIEKYLGGNYRTFSFNIVPYKDFDKYNKSVEAIIKIYADDKLIYTSERITRKTESEKVTISVEGVDYLRIELNAATDLMNYYNQYSIIVDGAILTEN